MTRGHPFLRVGIITVLGWGALGGLDLKAEAFSKSRTFPLPPTLAFDTHGSVSRGGEVTLRLSAVPSYGSLVTFEIIKGPEHGRIESLKNDSDHTARVVYTNDGGDDALSDCFFFKCKAPGRAKSATYSAFISVVPRESRLVFEPKDFDFGDVCVGESNGVALRVVNTGAPTSGRLVTPVGFTLSDDGKYDLKEGGETSFSVEFHPLEARSYAGSLEVVPHVAMDAVVFRGRGISRYTLESPPGGACLLFNRSRQRIKINFSFDPAMPGLSPPRELVIDSGKRIPIAFQDQLVAHPRASAEAGASGMLRLVLNDGLTVTKIDVPTKKKNVPVVVLAVSPQYIPCIRLQDSVPVKFRIMNPGEIAVNLRWTASSVSGGDFKEVKNISIPAGACSDALLEWKPDVSGEALLDVAVSYGDKEEHLFWQVGNVEKKARSISRSEEKPLSQTAPLPSVEPIRISSFSPSTNAPPPLQGLMCESSLSWSGNPRLKLWFSSGLPSGVAGLKIEEELLIVGREALLSYEKNPEPLIPSMKEDLRPLDDVVQKNEAHRIIFVARGLSPGWHMIRVSGISESGKTTGLARMPVLIPSSQSWYKVWRFPLGLLALLGLLFVYRKLSGIGF